MSRILNPFEKTQVEIKILFDTKTGQASLTSAIPLDSFLVVKILLSLVAGFVAEIENQSRMLVGQKPMIQTEERHGENNGTKESNNEN